MKNLIKRYERALKESDEAYKAYELDPVNTELEEAFGKAYKKEYELYLKLTSEIVKFTGGQIDENTAKRMIKTKLDNLKRALSFIR